MSGALDPIQEDLPLDLPTAGSQNKSSGEPAAGTPKWKRAQPSQELRPTPYEQLWKKVRALPWARWRAQAAPILRSGAGHLKSGAGHLKSGAGHLASAAGVAARHGGTAAQVAIKRGAPYTMELAKATARISLIRAFPLVVARTIHLIGFPAVVVRTAIQFTIAHRAGLAIDEVTFFRVDDPAGYTVYEAPPRLGTAIAITYVPTLVLWLLAVLCFAPALTARSVLHLPTSWVTWIQIWLGLAFGAHGLPSYEEAGPVAEQARLGVGKADPVAVFWVIPAQIVAVITRLGGILPAVVGAFACWWLAGAMLH